VDASCHSAAVISVIYGHSASVNSLYGEVSSNFINFTCPSIAAPNRCRSPRSNNLYSVGQQGKSRLGLKTQRYLLADLLCRWVRGCLAARSPGRQDSGAENWAMLASLIETCKLHSVNPQAYLTDVLTKLVKPRSIPGAGSSFSVKCFGIPRCLTNAIKLSSFGRDPII
jgi:IS66 C-terminal element